MSELILNDSERFLLRHLNEHCPIPQLQSALGFPTRNEWSVQPDTDNAVRPVMERMTYDDFVAALFTLREFGLAAGGHSTSSDRIHITPEGRQFVRDLDNPDILGAFWWRVRRNKCLAYAVLFFTALGVFGGLVSLVIDAVALTGWLFGGG